MYLRCMKTLLPALMLLSGCTINRNGVVHHVIIGFGIVSVQSTNQATIVKAKSLGVYAGPRNLTLGLSAVTVADIPTNSNVLIEIK